MLNGNIASEMNGDYWEEIMFCGFSLPVSGIEFYDFVKMYCGA